VERHGRLTISHISGIVFREQDLKPADDLRSAGPWQGRFGDAQLGDERRTNGWWQWRSRRRCVPAVE